MADNIPVPQAPAPPNMQFQQPDMSGIAAIYNRPHAGDYANTVLNDIADRIYSRHIQQQQLKVGAFEAGGPYLMNQLYGGGNPPQQTFTPNPNSQMPQAGDSNQNPLQGMTPGPQPQGGQQPPSPMGTGQGQSTGAAGVGGPSPTNGMSSPQTPAQTMPNQSQQPGQPLMHPTSGLPQTIHDSIAAGMPDYAGMMNQAGQYQQEGKYGREQIQNLGNMAALAKAPIEYQQAQAGLQKSQNDIAMQPTQAALQQQQLANAQQQVPMEQKKEIAGEISKQSQDSQQIRDLQTLASNLHASIGQNLGMGGNLKGDIFRATGGRAGSGQAANMQNSTIPLATGLNTVLSHRFNAGEVAALSQSLIPQPKDTPAYQQQKLQNLNNLLGVMATGNVQNVRNVAAAITTGQIPSVNPPGTQPQTAPAPQIPQGRLTVKSPTGQIGHIPQSQLKQALAQGYTQQ